MIPAHNQSGVLPPFLPGMLPTQRSTIAPYKTSLLEVAQRFSNTPTRSEIIKGLISYRSKLHNKGITSGFQWIDGSFVEDVENNQGRPPKDVDIITFANRPSQYNTLKLWCDFIQKERDLFSPKVNKQNYMCDAYYVDLQIQPEALVSQTKYWFGLFSHQRDTFLWKGMLEINLNNADDKDVISFLHDGGSDDSQTTP